MGKSRTNGRGRNKENSSLPNSSKGHNESVWTPNYCNALSTGSKQAPYAVNVKATPINGLDRDRFIDIGQIRSIDHSRVLGLVGVLEKEYWEPIRKAINLVLGFSV